MPTYDYRCNECDHEFEAFQSMTEDALTECKKCDGKILRIISKNVGIAFNGSGFYINDSKAKKTETKTESKPKPKTETKASKSK